MWNFLCVFLIHTCMQKLASDKERLSALKQEAALCLQASQGADLIVFNLFSLEGFFIAKHLHISCIAASPHVLTRSGFQLAAYMILAAWVCWHGLLVSILVIKQAIDINCTAWPLSQWFIGIMGKAPVSLGLSFGIQSTKFFFFFLVLCFL